MEQQKQVVKVCYHCGREGLQNLLFSHKEDFYNGENDYDNSYETSEHFYWDVVLCPVCKMLSLSQQYYFSEEIDQNGEPIVYEKTVYPATTLSARNVPKSVIGAFESARRVPDPVIRLMALRRTLDLICKDKKADKLYKDKHPKHKGNVTLAAMLKILEQENILPKMLSSSSWVVKELGNDATHDTSEVLEFEIKEIANIVETIIHYLYELPSKIKRLTERYLSKKEAPQLD